MSKKIEAENENLTFEQAYSELEKIVETLESNQGALEENMKLFERGQFLAQYCAKMLDTAELKIRQLSSNSTSLEENS
jgi:exodeoxyribonuclease VII small subunit